MINWISWLGIVFVDYFFCIVDTNLRFFLVFLIWLFSIVSRLILLLRNIIVIIIRGLSLLNEYFIIWSIDKEIDLY